MEYVQGVSVKGYVMTHGHMDGQEVLRKNETTAVFLTANS